MNDIFTIFINNEPLQVRKLNFKNYDGAFEIWKESSIQFILVYEKNRNINHAWNVDCTESLKVSQHYINKIISAIDSHYALHIHHEKSY